MSGRPVSLSPWMAGFCAIGLISLLWAPAAPAQTATGSPPPSASEPTIGPMNKDQLEMAARYQECRQRLRGGALDLVADMAEVLTPQQRTQLLDRFDHDGDDDD